MPRSESRCPSPFPGRTSPGARRTPAAPHRPTSWNSHPPLVSACVIIGLDGPRRPARSHPPRNVTGLLDALTDKGYVARQPHPTDRRATLVSLTDHGRTTIAKLRANAAPWPLNYSPVDYIIECLHWRDEIGAAAIEVDNEAMQAQQRWMHQAIAETVWQPRGRVGTSTPAGPSPTPGPPPPAASTRCCANARRILSRGPGRADHLKGRTG